LLSNTYLQLRLQLCTLYRILFPEIVDTRRLPTRNRPITEKKKENSMKNALGKGVSGVVLVAILGAVIQMVLSPLQLSPESQQTLYLLKCYAFYPIYKIIGGFHSMGQNIDGYYYYDKNANPPGKIAEARAYEPTSKDFFLSTYPKSGTHAGMQMLVHLLSKGKMCEDGCDLHKMVYAAEFGPRSARNMSEPVEEYPTQPRIIGTHMPAHHLKVHDAPCKYLYILRNPVNTLLSLRTMNYFMFGPVLRQPLDEFVTYYTATRETGWADHVHAWWRLRKLDNVHIVFYEDMVNKPEKTIVSLAKFANIKLNKKEREVIVKRMSKKWAIENIDTKHFAVVTPFSPPKAFRDQSGSASAFIVDHDKYFSQQWSEKFTNEQVTRIKMLEKEKLLRLDAKHNVSDGANFISERGEYF